MDKETRQKHQILNQYWKLGELIFVIRVLMNYPYDNSIPTSQEYSPLVLIKFLFYTVDSYTVRLCYCSWLRLKCWLTGISCWYFGLEVNVP